MDLTKLSSYQNPEGQLSDRLAPRTNMRKSILDKHLGLVEDKTVLDIGCNNGFFTREAMRRGARRAVGVDVSDAIIGARELAREEGVLAEFWQTSADSREFRRFCPKFDVVFLFSVLTHLKDKEEFLDWLDGIVRYAIIFESNHGEPNKKHIELIKKHIHLESVEYLGASDIPEKPHYLWICRRWSHSQRYTFLQNLPVEFIPLHAVNGWDEKALTKQKGGYPLDSDRFKELKEDIKQRGLRDPIVLHEVEGKIYGFQGAHRYFAAKQLGFKDIPCQVIRGLRFNHLKR